MPVFVSAVAAWEMAMLVSKGRINESKDVARWFEEFIGEGAFSEAAVTREIFIAACFLHAPLHKDPFDRILIATAREHDLTIITRDQAILAYGAAGHVRVMAC